MPLPVSLRSKWSVQEVEDFMLMCSQAVLPDFSIMTTPIKTYGVSKEMPYEKTSISFSLSFYVLADFKIKMFFEDWQRSVIDPDTGFIGIYEDYITDFKVQMESPEKLLEYDVSLFQCYPKNVNAIDLSAHGEPSAMILTVEFACLKWKRNKLNVKY